MSKTSIKFLLTFSIMLLCSFYCISYAEEKIDKALWEKALKIHNKAIVVDTHCDTPMVMYGRKVDIGNKTDEAEIDLIKMKEGGLDAAFFAIFTPNSWDEKHPCKGALEMIDTVYEQVAKYSNLAEMAFTPDDVRRIHKSGKRIILLGMENGGPIESSLALLRMYQRLGVRYITLTHSSPNSICDSSMSDEEKWNGLSPFGREVVQEMNRLGIMIDVSHISDKAFWDVLELSKAPVIASHSCVRSLCSSKRNLSDEMIKALAKKGGVIQINFYSGFLSDEYNKKAEEVRKSMAPLFSELREKYKDNEGEYYNQVFEAWKKVAPPSPKLDVLIDHIDYAVKLVGADYVGLGSDFDGAGSYPEGMENASCYPMITYKLLQRGYSEQDIEKILGGNLLRVFDEVLKNAGRN